MVNGPEHLSLPEQPPEPEALFMAHVDRVRAEGDAFDAYSARSRYLQAIVSGGIGPFAYHGDHRLGSVVANGVAGAVAFAAHMVYHPERDKKEEAKALTRFDDAAQLKNDAYYELYRTKKATSGDQNIVMRWYGPVLNNAKASADEELKRVTTLALEADIATLLVEPGLLGPGTSAAEPSRHSTMARWLKTNKGISVSGGAAKDAIIEATPEQWLTYLRAKRPPTRNVTVPGVLRYAGDSTVPFAATAKAAGFDAITAFFPLYMVAATGDPNTATAKLVHAKQAVREPMEPARPYQIQTEHALHIKPSHHSPHGETILHRTKEKVRAVTFCLGTLAVITNVQGGIDTLLTHRESQASDQIAREHNVDPEHATVDPDSIRARVDSWSWINKAWGDWRDMRDETYKKASEQLKGGSGLEGNKTVSGIAGDVGNIEGNDTSPAWKLTTHNIDPSELRGHWSVATARQATASKESGETIPTLRWDLDSLNTTDSLGFRTYVPPTGLSETSEMPWIKATGEMYRFMAARGQDAYTQIAVLEGYTISAANVNGTSIEVTHKIDNTYVLRIPAKTMDDLAAESQIGNATGVIEYYMTYTGEDGPIATGRVSLATNSSQMGSKPSFGFDRKKANEIYQQYISELKAGTSVRSLISPEAFEEYMHREFTYSLAPYPMDDLEEADGVEDLIQSSFDTGKANCNAAMNTMVWAYPMLNPVIEYNNEKDPLVLSNDEAHARVVSADPDVSYDPTPPLPLRSTKEDEQPARMPVLPIGVLLGTMAIAGLASTRRNRALILRGAIATLTAGTAAAARRATRGIEWSDGQVLREAVALSDHVQWSSDTSKPMDPGLLAKTGANTATGPVAAFEALKNPDRHTKETINKLRRQPGFTKTHEKALRTARRAARKQ